MSALCAFIRQEIKVHGAISLGRYIDLCLNHPEHGYYRAKRPFGAEGDFITAPEISQMFGELIGLWIAHCWQERAMPAPFTLAELGPGRGTMMADIWRATAKIPGFHEAAELSLIESSPQLRRIQAKALSFAKPKWYDDCQNLPEHPLFFVANEFFDALPIEQFLRTDTGWHQRQIDYQGGKFTTVFIPSSNPPFGIMRDNDTQAGDWVEDCKGSHEIMSVLAKHIARFGGAGLVIDYGDWRTLGDTLQAVRSHERSDPFQAPGQSDLSAHVDFEALTRAAPELSHTRLTPQGVFLNRLGINQRATILAKNLTGAALEKHMSVHTRLTNPDQMGTLFKALAFYRAQDPFPLGFSPENMGF